jgi:hypothetical protein
VVNGYEKNTGVRRQKPAYKDPCGFAATTVKIRYRSLNVCFGTTWRAIPAAGMLRSALASLRRQAANFSG